VSRCRVALVGFDLIFTSFTGLLEEVLLEAGITVLPHHFVEASSELFSSFKASSGNAGWKPWTDFEIGLGGERPQRQRQLTTGG